MPASQVIPTVGRREASETRCQTTRLRRPMGEGAFVGRRILLWKKGYLGRSQSGYGKGSSRVRVIEHLLLLLTPLCTDPPGALRGPLRGAFR